ncbi:MAG: hypothetical protein QM784_04665 [Polyangiaceae bacterium]
MLPSFGSITPGYARRATLTILPLLFHTTTALAGSATATATAMSGSPEASAAHGAPWTDEESAPDKSDEKTRPPPTVAPPLPEEPPPETTYPFPDGAQSAGAEDELPTPAEGAPIESEHSTSTPSSLQLNFGLEWWFVRDKGIFGPTLRLGGRWVTAHVDWSFIRLWDDNPALDSRWLGSIAGLYLSVSPIHTRRVETHLGLGTDIHWLHGIHSEEAKAALAARASIHFWTGDGFGLFGTARTYLASSSGLGLGETINHTRDLPLMLTLGVELREPREKHQSSSR